VCHVSPILSADFVGQLNHAHKSRPTLSFVWHPLKLTDGALLFVVWWCFCLDAAVFPELPPLVSPGGGSVSRLISWARPTAAAALLASMTNCPRPRPCWPNWRSIVAQSTPTLDRCWLFSWSTNQPTQSINVSIYRPVERGEGGKLPRASRRLGAPTSPNNIKYTRMHHFKKKKFKKIPKRGPAKTFLPAVPLDGPVYLSSYIYLHRVRKK